MTLDGTTIWTASRVFQKGDVVTYQDKLWKALYYTRNQAPGNPAGAWAEQPQSADVTPAAWAASKVYTLGDQVTFKGHVYEAKWYTRNQEPGATSGPWKLIK